MSERGAAPSVAPRDRFTWLEYPGDDFPYYDGVPVRLTGGQWLFVMAMVALGFAALVAPLPFLPRGLGELAKAILFAAIPLAGLALVAKGHWTAIFRRIRGRDVLWMVVFAILNTVVSVLVGWLVMTVFGAASNPSLAGLPGLSVPERVLFFLKTLPQLFGEEVLTILPFLALLALLRARTALSRRVMVFWAWVLSAVVFGAAHLPTYSWNLVQCLIVIGSARLMLTLPYIKTKNIWVSTGAHVLNDWTFFALTLLGSAVAR